PQKGVASRHKFLRRHHPGPTTGISRTKKGETAMNRKITFAFLAVCCLAVAITVVAQGGGDTSANIQQLEKDMHHAQMNSDVAWYQQHLADGYVEGHSWGDWATKAEAIKQTQDKSIKFTKGEI